MGVFWSQIEQLIDLLLFMTPFEHLLHGYFGFRLDGFGPGCGWISPLCKRKNRKRDPVEVLEKVC